MLWLIGISIFFVLSMIYLGIRNEWVYRQRTKILNDERMSVVECLNKYSLLPEYNEMFWKLWIWDVNKFMRD